MLASLMKSCPILSRRLKYFEQLWTEVLDGIDQARPVSVVSCSLTHLILHGVACSLDRALPCSTCPPCKAVLTFPDRDPSDFHFREAAICCIVQHRALSAYLNFPIPLCDCVYKSTSVKSGGGGEVGVHLGVHPGGVICGE